jgi:hypothetical protein
MGHRRRLGHSVDRKGLRIDLWGQAFSLPPGFCPAWTYDKRAADVSQLRRLESRLQADSLAPRCRSLAKMVTGTKFRDDQSTSLSNLPARKFEPVTTFAEYYALGKFELL